MPMPLNITLVSAYELFERPWYSFAVFLLQDKMTRKVTQRYRSWRS